MGVPDWYDRGIRSEDEKTVWIAHATKLLLEHERRIDFLTGFVILQFAAIVVIAIVL